MPAGETINTPSMLAVEDVIFALEWAKSVMAPKARIARSNANAAALGVVEEGAGSAILLLIPRRAHHLRLPDGRGSRRSLHHMARWRTLSAYDIAGISRCSAPPHWCGATVDTADRGARVRLIIRSRDDRRRLSFS